MRDLGVSRPIRQDSKLTLIANGTFEADDLRIDKNGAAIRDDRLRVIDAGLRASWNGASATLYSAKLRMRKGLDAFGASLQATDQGHGFEVTEFAGDSGLGAKLEVAAPLTGPDIEGKHKASVFAELSYRF